VRPTPAAIQPMELAYRSPGAAAPDLEDFNETLNLLQRNHAAIGLVG